MPKKPKITFGLRVQPHATPPDGTYSIERNGRRVGEITVIHERFGGGDKWLVLEYVVRFTSSKGMADVTETFEVRRANTAGQVLPGVTPRSQLAAAKAFVTATLSQVPFSGSAG